MAQGLFPTLGELLGRSQPGSAQAPLYGPPRAAPGPGGGLPMLPVGADQEALRAQLRELLQSLDTQAPSGPVNRLPGGPVGGMQRHGPVGGGGTPGGYGPGRR